MLDKTNLSAKVAANTAQFRSGMRAAGFTVLGAEDHPICPVFLGDAKLASIFADEMMSTFER